MRPEFEIDPMMEPEIDDDFLMMQHFRNKKSKKKKEEIKKEIASYIG
jgi:hypothetical protein